MRIAAKIILALLAALLLIETAFSLKWPIAHDEAPLFYEAFLMRGEGRVPYRGIFDFQMPGSFAAYYALGLLSGFDGLRIRILDLLILTALLVIAFFTMRGFGKSTALAAALLFGLKYLEGGPSMSLQREYLLLIFVALAVWINMRDDLTPKHRLLIGFFFGLSAVIKPHASLGLVPILLFDMAGMIKSQNLTPLNAALQSGLPTLSGFLVPVIGVFAWLGFTGALSPFLDIAKNYWPLYAQINGQMEVNAGAARWSFMLDQVWRLGGSGTWIIPAALGVYLNRNKQTWLLASLALCYAIYPAFSGQFFPYHYIPFVYFIVLLASLAIIEHPSSFLFRFSSFILLLVILANIHPAPVFLRQLGGKPIVTSTDRAAEIALYLEENLEEGDTVQPLDWTGGTLLAMLETRARIATPFVFDFYFYHHVSQPYIQSLRAKFMNDLQASPPRFVVEVTAIDKPWISGPGTSREFPELRAFLDGNYSVTIQKDDYVIYERR
ncbi:MAG: hypothetical protein HZB19_02430 [Chloroflexi bacterium]|nr:hypothetical protein [Chloroflexota bacterium]